MTTGHDLPSGRHLADLHGFFKTAAFNANGTANLVFTIPAELKARLVDISVNDGMALNISVWETKVPEGDEWLAEALGLPGAEKSKVLEKKVRADG